MPYNQQFIKFTFIFSVTGEDEIADTSINYTRASGAWAGAAATLAELDEGNLEEMGGFLVSAYGVSGGRWADYSSLAAVKAAAIGTDGHYVAEPLLWIDDDPTSGTVIGNPIQVTTVASLRSGATLGTGNYGRMYLPHFYMSQLTANPHADSTQIAGLALAVADFISACTEEINTVVTAPLYPAIMSQAGSGSAKEITEVRVGNVNDTQRRRRAQLIETYATHAVS